MTTHTVETTNHINTDISEVAKSYQEVKKLCSKENQFLNDGSNVRPAVINTCVVSIKF